MLLLKVYFVDFVEKDFMIKVMCVFFFVYIVKIELILCKVKGIVSLCLME